jgi:hypothetical protein
MTYQRYEARVAWVGTALLLVFASGCCYLPVGSKPRAAQPLPASLAAAYAHEHEEQPSFERQELKGESKYSIHRIQLFATGRSQNNRNIVFDYYAPARAGKHPLILVLPIFGGKSYPLERHFASYFARRGLAAVIVHREKWRSDSVTAEEINTMLEQTVLDNKRVLDWVETQEELDSTRIGVFGASMGAIKGALLTPLENRVRAAVLGLVGGDLPYIVSYSTEKGIARQRKAYLQEHSMPVKELQEELCARITCDPNTLAPYIDPKSVLLILAACDTVVPVKKGLELRRKMGNPETIVIPTGHYTAVIYLPYIQSQAIRFFRQKFAQENRVASAPR